MSFYNPPPQENKSTKPFVEVFPEDGPQNARVSLVVDLGHQEVEYEDKQKEEKYTKMIQGVALFFDLVDSVVDYGNDIGKKQYRAMLNSTKYNIVTKRQDIIPLSVMLSAPRDASGNIVEGGRYSISAKNKLMDIINATGEKEVAYTAALDSLINKPLAVDVAVEEWEKNGKTGKNVKFKAFSRIRKNEKVTELEEKAVAITFNNAELYIEELSKLRRGVVDLIKKAKNYAGSAMERAIAKAEELRKNRNPVKEEVQEEEPVVVSKKKAARVDDLEDDEPF